VKERIQGQERWLKAELHAHCNLDPADSKLCSYSAEELIGEAARLGYQVLSIACHDIDVWTTELCDYAGGQGITLIPGMEVTTEGSRHTLVYNFGIDAEKLRTLDEIRAHRRPDTLVVAPHPYFPGTSCLRRLLERNIDVFDAIELSGFYVPGIDFNRRARQVAAASSKPLIGNADVHQLWQLGRTFTWIHAQPGISSILNAVKNGRVRIESCALSYTEVVRWWTTALPLAFANRFPIRVPAQRRLRKAV